MAIGMLSPLHLDIFAYIGCIVAVIYCRLKGVITVIISYSCLSSTAFGFLPYKLVPVAIFLAEIASIGWICITYNRALKAYSMGRNLL
jgi:hypothetical protein